MGGIGVLGAIALLAFAPLNDSSPRGLPVWLIALLLVLSSAVVLISGWRQSRQ